MRQFASRAQARRSRHLWMATVETHVNRIEPRMAGKIDWNAATFFFDQGLNPAEAASRMVGTNDLLDPVMAAAFATDR